MREESTKPPAPTTYLNVGEQHGCLARHQLLDLGISSAAIGRLTKAGRLLPLHRGLYVVGGHEVTWPTRVMAAVLACGPHAFASHRSAAALWGLLDPNRLVEVTAARRVRCDGVTIHRAVLERPDTTLAKKIPSTSVHRTLVDIGDVVSKSAVEDALERALDRKMTSARWLERQLSRLGTRGRKGASVLRSILDEGDEEKWPSWLERRFIRLLHGAHMSEYEREHRACGGKYRLDFAWPGALLGIEVHGGKWHRRRLRWDEDLARHNELTAAGWTILHFTFKQLRDDPARVIAEIRATYDRLWGGRLDVFSR